LRRCSSSVMVTGGRASANCIRAQATKLAGYGRGPCGRWPRLARRPRRDAGGHSRRRPGSPRRASPSGPRQVVARRGTCPPPGNWLLH
jgi:hypothetical protein